MTTLHLSPQFFSDRERVLAEETADGLSVSLFRFDSGVCAARLRNAVGELVVLPYQGQQIWSARMAGRELTMRSMFDQPYPTRVFLDTYGGFLLHCGFTAMGGPSKDDAHALHGELPNAPYRSAHIEFGRDVRGSYVAIGGAYRHTVAFGANYVAEPRITLYADSALFSVSMQVTNLKRAPMEYMYLAHINFRPLDGARLVYSAQATPEHVRVRRSVPAHIAVAPGYRELLEELALHPEKHHVFSPQDCYDPEVVFLMDYVADAQGWAHTMQVLPDGSADYVRHRPAQLDHAIRWISRTGDQDALAMIEPATSGVEGLSAERAKGTVKSLPGGATWRCDMDMGVLDAVEARRVASAIEASLRG